MAAVQGVTVSADLPGTVDRIAFESGAAVREGDVLVELDTRQERAQLAAAEADRELARRIVKRMQAMSDEGVISQTDYDRAIAEDEQTAARVGEIRADDRAQDDPRAVLGDPRHPSGEPRAVSLRRAPRSCRCSRSTRST